MIESIVGNRTAEKVLLYMANYEEGYAKGIADTFDVPVSMIQRQLERFEIGGLLVSQKKGMTRLYTWSPRFILKQELLILLKKVLSLLPDNERKKYFEKRTRPRRRGKPL